MIFQLCWKKITLTKVCALYGFENNGIVSHAEVVIGTPDLYFVFDVASMGDRELGGEPVDIVKIAVGLVVMLLVKFFDKELLIVKASRRRGFHVLSCGRGRPENIVVRTTRRGGCRIFRGFGSVHLCLLFGCGRSEIVCHAGGSTSGGSVGALLYARTGGKETLVLVNLLYVDVSSYASITSDDLAGTECECWTHDGAFRCLLCKQRDGGVTRRSRGAEVTERGRFGPA